MADTLIYTVVQGTTVTLQATFATSGGVTTDPTTVSFAFVTPIGLKTTYVYLTDAQIVKTSTGIYYVALSMNAGGPWTYEWIGTGAVAIVRQSAITVTPSVGTSIPIARIW